MRKIVQVLSRTQFDFLYGDVQAGSDYCRDSLGSLVHHQTRATGDVTWHLECWEPAHCIIEDRANQDISMIALVPDSNTINSYMSVVKRLRASRISGRTLLLPWNRDVVTYAFLPLRIGATTMTFVTSVLSGCGFFVARPDNLNCNLVVFHANVYCRVVVEDNVDYHHQQAIAAIEEIHAMNSRCRYQIYRRWAPEHHQQVIAVENYHYSDKIHYYSMRYHNFLYSYNFGGFFDIWQFCIRGIGVSFRQTCYSI